MNLAISNRLDRAAPLPLFYQIKEAIATDLAAKGLPVLSRLPTIQELARQYGVTKTTANRAIAELCREGLLESRRRRGIVLIKAVPARARAGGITVAVPGHDRLDPATNPHTWFVALDMLRGISDACAAAGLTQSLRFLSDGETAAGTLLGNGPVIAISFLPPELEQAILAKGATLVVAASSVDDSEAARGVSYVTTNLTHGAEMAVDALAKTGCRRIAFIGGPLHKHWAAQRLTGYRRALERNGLELSRARIGECELGEEEGRRAMDALLRKRIRFDGLFAMDDLRAIGAIRALKARGVRIPDDVSVVGFDDIPAAAACSPPLSTIRVPRDSIGGEAVRMLEAIRLDGQAGPRAKTLPCELVIRQTTRPMGGTP